MNKKDRINKNDNSTRASELVSGNKKARQSFAQKTGAKTGNLPSEGWPVLDQIKKFFMHKEVHSAIIILVFFAAALSTLFISPQLYLRSMHEGDIALKDIYAPYDFTYNWGINEDLTQKAKEAAVSAVPFSVRRDPAVEKKMSEEMAKFFDVLDEQKKSDAQFADKLLSIRGQTGTDLSDKNIKTLLEYRNIKKISKSAQQVQENVFLIGYITDENADRLKSEGFNRVIVFDEKTGLEMERSIGDLLDKEKVQGIIESYAVTYIPDRKLRPAVSALVKEYVKPNLEPDEKRTALKKEETSKNFLPVYNTFDVSKNELIVEKGTRVNARHIAQVSQLRQFRTKSKQPGFFLGMTLLFLLMGLVAAVYMHFTRKKTFLSSTKDIGIVLLNMYLMLAIAQFIIRAPQPSYFIPLAGMGMMTMLLSGFNGAFLSVLLMSSLIAILTGGKIEVGMVLLISSVVGMYAVRNARKRSDILWAGLLAGIAKFISIVCVGLISGIEPEVFASDGLWGVASGVFSGFIVMGLLPVFEHLFKVPTNISLLELSDMNHPLLKKLAMEAPGTYHHSVMVGNLAEAACDCIGANSLLARVGAYYHDIGKIAKASYFSENEMGAPSKHSKLTPSMSALIIAKHVKEGAEVAKKYKLNNTLVDFITQHHGDSLISFFYQKAIEKSEKGEGEVLKEENFRYPGPKPQTKETAIVLLADAVEASSRSLEEPTPSSIRNLVRKIINNKFIDGQLDECDLTLRDMHNIADCFVRVLMGVFHTRLNYPEETKKNG